MSQTVTVWKFPVPIESGEVFEIEMPQGATILSFQTQLVTVLGTKMVNAVLWALVDPEAEKESRKFFTRGTGHPIQVTDDFQFGYHGTAQNNGYVWHLFEVVT